MALDINNIPWNGLYPPAYHDNYKDIMKKYPFKVKIDIEKTSKIKAGEMEDWCFTYCGKLNEFSSKSTWQVAIIESPINPPTFVEVLCFYFHNKEDALAFKLSWSDFLFNGA